MKKTGLILLILLVNFYGFSQKISKYEMIKDLEYLVKSIKLSYSQYELREKITGVKFESYFKQKKTYLENNKVSDGEFSYIIESVLKYTQNQHNVLIHPNWISHYDSNIVKELFPNRSVKERCSYFYNEKFSFLSSKTKYEYIKKAYIYYKKGSYYTSLPIKSKNEIIPFGTELIKINNQPVDSIIYENLDNISCHWDKENTKYYSEDIFFAHSLILNQDSVTLTLKNNGLKNVVLKYGEKSIFKKTPWLKNSINRISYFNKEKILYIRLIAMSDFGKDFIRKISKYSKKEINKVIIDIRGNGGGNDMFWIEVLRNLIKEPLNVNSVKVGFKNYEQSSKFYSDLFTNYKTEVLPYLTDTFYTVNAYDRDLIKYLKPDSNSLKYSGKIYIIQDKNVFSSAISLTTLGLYSEKIIVCGEETGFFGGFGEEPLLFTLPNSKLLYQLESSLDYSRISQISDYINKVEISIEYDSKDIFLRTSKNWSPYTKGFLRKKDPFFRYIIGIK